VNDSSPKDEKPVTQPRADKKAGTATPDAAFDLWLQRGLQTIYGDVAKEPIPAELLALIEASSKNPQG
jgi:hypothetical protein